MLVRSKLRITCSDRYRSDGDEERTDLRFMALAEISNK
jgi:hypothetical protein